MSEITPQYLENVLGWLEGLRVDGDGWSACCPVAGHGEDGEDRNPSLRVTVGEDGRVLLCCRVGCPTDTVLGALELEERELFCPPGDEPAVTLSPETAEPTEEDLDTRDRVYREFLMTLGLEGVHQQELSRRGLDNAYIARWAYATLRESAKTFVFQDLGVKFGLHNLLGVPGFGVDGITRGVSGLVIPVRDRLNRIVALKVRQAREPKYTYLSGSLTQLRAPVHHAGLGFPGAQVRITEGELKADVAAHRTGVRTLGVPGVTQWRLALPLLSAGAVVRLAFDWADVKTKPGVFRQTLLCLQELLIRGHRVFLEYWDGPHKGIDDALAAGVDVQTAEGEDAVALLRQVSPLQEEAVPQTAVVLVGGCELQEARYNSPFPLEALPASVAVFVRDVSGDIGCGPDYCGLGCLAVAGGVLGTSVSLRLSRFWKEYPALYAVGVGNAGDGKSPSLKAATRPVLKLQRELEDAGVNLFTSDSTTEALAGLLGANPRGLLYFAEELTHWVTSMNAYKGGSGGDRQFFLSLWSCEARKVDRKGQQGHGLFLPNPFITVLGGIPPAMLGELKDGKGRDDGFLDRLLFAAPRNGPARYWQLGGAQVAAGEAPSAVAWEAVVRRLAGLEAVPCPLRLSPDGEIAWKAWYDTNADEFNAEGFEEFLRGPWSKFRAYMGRLTLISHVLLWACGEGPDLVTDPVGVEAVRRATLLVDYFKNQARKVHTLLGQGADDGKVDTFLEWVRRGSTRRQAGRATLREVVQGKVAGVRSVKDARKLASEAVDRLHGAWSDKETFTLS